MTNFAEALARIEWCRNEGKCPTFIWKHAHEAEIKYLLVKHAASVVQLGKVAEDMRNRESIAVGDDNYEELSSAAQAYDKLMKGG